jgi:hypothetical protein
VADRSVTPGDIPISQTLPHSRIAPYDLTLGLLDGGGRVSQGERSRPAAPEGDSAPRLRAAAQWLRARFLNDGRWQFWANFTNLAVVFAACVLWGVLLQGRAVAISLLAALLTFYGVLLQMIRSSSEAAPRLWAPLTLMSLSAALTVVTAAAGIVRLVDHETAQVITSKVGLSGNHAMGSGESATVELPGDASRSHLSLTFALTDTQPGAPSCKQGSRLRVGKRTVSPGEAADITPVPARLTVRLTIPDPRGCELDLSVQKATSDN